MIGEFSEGKTEPGFALRRLRLVDFRNYEHLEIEVPSGLTLLTGRNGQGKTNLLEAVYFLSTTRPLRGGRASEAVRFGQGVATIEGELAGSRTLLGLEIRVGSVKRAFLNGASLPRASDLVGRLPSVSVSLHDQEMVRGEAGARRELLDLVLAQTYPAYLAALASYKRALEQRNALLRRCAERAIPPSHFEPWELEMARAGTVLRGFRVRLISELAPIVDELNRTLSQGESLALAYEARDEAGAPEELAALWEATRTSDVERGTTQSGPHRDDFRLTIDGRLLKTYGSQGQQRTASLSVKLALVRYWTRLFGKSPVILLDDVYSDLDQYRQQVLTELLADHSGQALLTCTFPPPGAEKLLNKAWVLTVNRGTVKS